MFLVSFPVILFASPLEGMNTWIEHQLSSNSFSLSAYFYLFLGGVLASMLPCTYPLYPITINILKARSTGSKKLVHPLVYFSGIASMYFLFGIIASFTGGAFNTILHFPLTNLMIALVIFLLGLSSMDLLHLSIFSGSSINTEKKSVAATYIMGMSAGLLSSACVGPVVVSILIGIASNSNSFNFLLGLTAATKMLLFGVGVGIPFLLIGVFGMSLPKSGKWMKYVQLVLGVLIMYFSFIYFEKAMLGYGFTEDTITLVVIGSIILLASVFHFQDDEMLTNQKTKRSLLVLATVVGSILIVKGFFPVSGINGNPISKTTAIPTEPKTEQKGQLTWYLDHDAAYALAKEKGKPVFIDFHADWCTNCKEFQKTTQSNPTLNEALKNAVLLKVYEGSATFKKYATDPRFPELKVGLPFFMITDKDENLLYKTNDYLKADEMSMFLSN
jgi:thiol:disulfide interchange protein DsbD